MPATTAAAAATAEAKVAKGTWNESDHESLLAIIPEQ